MQINKGFLLTSHSLDSKDGFQISLFGTNGESAFRLIFNNERIVFFIPHKSDFDPIDIKFERKSTGLKSFNHELADTIYLNKYSDIQKVKDYCTAKGIRTFELDIIPHERFLMERFINGYIEFSGKAQDHNGIMTYINPQIRKSKALVNLKKLSLDIETGIKGELYSIAMHMQSDTDDKKVILMIGDETSGEMSDLNFFPNEASLLESFLKTFHKWDPDFIVGWHVIGFDLMFLEKKLLKYNMELSLGRDNSKAYLDERKGVGFIAKINGRVVLDGPPILRSAFYRFKNFKLETVASEVLGTGKDIASDSGKVTEIERRFKEDKVALAKYNLLDCTLVLDIFEKLKLFELLVKRVEISGLLIDRLAVSTAAFDHVFLPKLHRKGYVAPNRIDITREDSSTGGLVIEPKAGLHQNISIFDFKSLYPSIIRTFFIDPYSLIQNDKDTIRTPAGYKFSKSEFILPNIIQTLLEQRQIAKSQNNTPLSQAVKILMNSFYGVMGSSRCRFYHTDLPSAITTTGHYLLKETMKYLELEGHQVIYGDTDSIFIKASRNFQAEELNNLTKKIDSFLSKKLKEEFGVESYLECEYEKTFDQLYFSMTRSGEGAAKKKYAGIIGGEIEFKGMEFVRSDWTELAKLFQSELYSKFFEGIDLESYIKEFIKNLEIGLYDDLLVYTKRLSKAPQEYTKNIPIHVKAALKIDHNGPYRLKEVSYIVTKDGPEPINNNPRNFDYLHYIEKQLKPIADDILMSQNKSFDSFIVGDQLTLF